MFRGVDGVNKLPKVFISAILTADHPAHLDLMAKKALIIVLDVPPGSAVSAIDLLCHHDFLIFPSAGVKNNKGIYLQSFAPDMDLQEFEERVCCVMENRMLVDVIDRALLRLKRYPDRGELYYEILTKQFIHRFNSTEKELLDELNMERSVFYDRKREAIFLLSLCLFGYAVPELQEELEMPRLYPD